MGRERPECFIAKKGGVGTGGIDRIVKSFQFLSGKKNVDTAKADEGGVLHREAFRELEFGNEWGCGE